MRTRHLASAALLPALLASACATTTVRTTTWDDGPAPERTGRVEWIRETVRQQQGEPVAGALAGAFIGGLIGSTIGGGVHYDRFGYAHHGGSAAGALVGAVGGAMVGAAASQGGAEERSYEVVVRFDDGGAETYVFPGYAPFRVGDPVRLTPRGLEPM